MSVSDRSSQPHRLNVLVLGGSRRWSPISTSPARLTNTSLLADGGGVRGLSSLLILRELMRHINSFIRDFRLASHHDPRLHDDDDLSPHDVFNFVGGTSTGGLIALMLGKLGMSVEDCITQYQELSNKIFGKKHIRGRITHGLSPSRYSGKRLRACVEDLLEAKGFGKEEPIVRSVGKDFMDCGVVCREHERASKFSGLKRGAVCICSHHCSHVPTCLICDAARATSAAPTYFPVSKIGNRYFVDGGMKYNNPSRALYYHLDQARRVEVSKRTYTSPHTAASSSRHGDLDFSYARYGNLGTGTQTSASPKRRREALAKFVPGIIRMAIFLKETLQEIAVESETVAGDMTEFEYLAKGNIKYIRFSAANGVCWIKLDKYREIPKIVSMTEEYIQNQNTQNALGKVAYEIAREYYTRHLAETNQSATSPTQAGPSLGLQAPHTAGGPTPQSNRLATHTPTSAPSTSRYSGSSVNQDGAASPPSISTGDQVEPESNVHAPPQPTGPVITADTKTRSPDSNTTQTTFT